MFIDAHNHLHDPRLGDPAPIITRMQETGIDSCVVNATCEEDWPLVEALAEKYPGFVLPAYGVHPWKAHLVESGWEERLHTLLDRHPEASIGECGLDRWVQEPDIALQAPVFEAQLRLAREFDRPVTIHCLKAWQALFDSFERIPPPRRFLMHSFNGSIETARRLLPIGAYFSFSGYFLHTRKAEVQEVFRQLPLDRILIETDAPDMKPPDDFIDFPHEKVNHPANLSAVARGFAEVMGLSPEELGARTSENFSRFFHDQLT
ncbi:MAG: TatD family hydrolase [Luteolibacter sp.]